MNFGISNLFKPTNLNVNAVSFKGSTNTQAPAKTEGYASIPYERAPKQGDTVQTMGKNNLPLLPGYNPPGRILDCLA